MENYLELEADASMPNLSQYYVVQYHHIDDFRCFHPLSKFFADPYFNFDYETDAEDTKSLEQLLRSNLASLFKKNGWEGDGNINCIIIPPCFVPFSDTSCQTVFHVKQDNNGTSFLAIPNNLKLELPEDF